MLLSLSYIVMCSCKNKIDKNWQGEKIFQKRNYWPVNQSSIFVMLEGFLVYRGTTCCSLSCKRCGLDSWTVPRYPATSCPKLNKWVGCIMKSLWCQSVPNNSCKWVTMATPVPLFLSLFARQFVCSLLKICWE